MERAVRYDLRESVARIEIDDGKVNALSPGLLADLRAALDRAEKEAGAVLLLGRPGRFSAGFDLSIMREGGVPMISLLREGSELALRLFEFPRPVVMGCTGHALAMGAILLLAGDTRLGVEGAFKIGLNEVTIGMTLPYFGIEFARERLSRRHLTRAVAEAEIYTPAGAVDAGFLDRLLPADGFVEEALAEAKRLAALSDPAHRNTKLRLRADVLERLRGSIDKELRANTPQKRKAP